MVNRLLIVLVLLSPGTCQLSERVSVMMRSSDDIALTALTDFASTPVTSVITDDETMKMHFRSVLVVLSPQ